MTCCDNLYSAKIAPLKERNQVQTQRVADEKSIFNILTQYASPTAVADSCESENGNREDTSSPVDIVAYFQNHNQSLFVDCNAHGAFSHCQQYYLFQFNSSSRVCQPFKRQPCRFTPSPSRLDIHRSSTASATLTFQLSLCPPPSGDP